MLVGFCDRRGGLIWGFIVYFLGEGGKFFFYMSMILLEVVLIFEVNFFIFNVILMF